MRSPLPVSTGSQGSRSERQHAASLIDVPKSVDKDHRGCITRFLGAARGALWTNCSSIYVRRTTLAGFRSRLTSSHSRPDRPHHNRSMHSCITRVIAVPMDDPSRSRGQRWDDLLARGHAFRLLPAFPSSAELSKNLEFARRPLPLRHRHRRPRRARATCLRSKATSATAAIRTARGSASGNAPSRDRAEIACARGRRRSR
jgi:hypothetical protein